MITARSTRAAPPSKRSMPSSSSNIRARMEVAVKSIEFPTPTTAIEDGITQVEAEMRARRRPVATRSCISSRMASG